MSTSTTPTPTGVDGPLPARGPLPVRDRTHDLLERVRKELLKRREKARENARRFHVEADSLRDQAEENDAIARAHHAEADGLSFAIECIDRQLEAELSASDRAVVDSLAMVENLVAQSIGEEKLRAGRTQ